LLLLNAIEGAEKAGNNLEKRMKKACRRRPPPTKVDGAGYFLIREDLAQDRKLEWGEGGGWRGSWREIWGKPKKKG
jgi:hypothetical protein